MTPRVVRPRSSTSVRSCCKLHWLTLRLRQWFVSVHTSASAVADLLITWVLIYTLRQNQKRGMQRYVSPLLRPFPSRFLWCVGAMCVLTWAAGW